MLFNWLRRLQERHFIALALLHFVAGTFYHLFLAPPPHTAEDYDIALHLLRGEGFSIYERGPTTAKGPFYPALLALFLWLFGDPAGLKAVSLVQQLLCSLQIWLLYRLGIRLGASLLGKGAALLFALHPSYVYSAGVMENTFLTILIATAGAILLLERTSSFSPSRMLCMGLMTGILFLEKPPMAYLALALLAWRLRLRLKSWLLTVSGFLMVVLPWSIRGWLTFGKMTLTKSYTVYLAMCQSWHTDFAISSRYTISPAWDRQVDSLYLLPEKEGLPALKALAIQSLTQNPWRWIERTFAQAAVFWYVPPRYFHNFSPAFLLVRWIPVMMLLGLWFLVYGDCGIRTGDWF